MQHWRGSGSGIAAELEPGTRVVLNATPAGKCCVMSYGLYCLRGILVTTPRHSRPAPQYFST
eukprot:4291318-Alexandrium_andersonii.AAC.1